MTIAVSRAERFAMARAGLPGLMHFGRAPRHVPAVATVTSLRLDLPKDGMPGHIPVPLHLDGLAVFTEAGDALGDARACLSSVHPVSGSAEGLLSGHAIHTETEDCPFWEVRFARPVPLCGLSVLNRNDVWSWRAYGLRVVGRGPEGEVFAFDNLGAGSLRQQRDALLAALLRARADLAFISLQPVARSVFALLRALDEALAGGPCDLEALRAARLDTLAALVELVRPLDDWQLRLALSYLTPLYEALIDRAFSEEGPAGTDVEAHAAALCLSSHFLHAGILDVRFILENEKFLPSIARLTLFEDDMNDVVGRVQGASPSRIMFRAHHISGDDLRAKPSRFLDTLDELIAALGTLGYEAALCYGTLLGAVRERNFIAHDDDVDLVVKVRGRDDAAVGREMEDLASRLRDIGVDASLYPGQIFLSAGSARGGERADIFPVIEREGGDTVGMYMQHLKVRDLPRDSVLPFRRLDFLGRAFPCPADPERFLADRYGEDWREPVRYLAGLMLR